jgi:hypothetical protein
MVESLLEQLERCEANCVLAKFAWIFLLLAMRLIDPDVQPPESWTISAACVRHALPGGG